MSSPLRSVLDAFEHGAASRADIGRITGLRDDVVDAALEHLIRLGHVSAQAMVAGGCPSGGCGSCSSGVDGAPGCGAPGPTPRRSGPVLVQLSLRR